ncbi:uncharacterized protein LOC144108902 isoform X3 [Amblyomma americanum]
MDSSHSAAEREWHELETLGAHQNMQQTFCWKQKSERTGAPGLSPFHLPDCLQVSTRISYSRPTFLAATMTEGFDDTSFSMGFIFTSELSDGNASSFISHQETRTTDLGSS